MSNRLIYVECNPDEALMQIFGFYKRNIKHSSGKTRIAKILEKNQGQMALVDEDPDVIPIPYFNKPDFSLIKQEDGYVIKKDIKREHIIIEIQPYLEEWVINACREASVNIKEFNLPNDPNSLHHIINNNLRKFQNLVNELLNHNCRIKKLKNDLITF